MAEEEESVVGVWTRESPHNYENNARVTEEFVCPSATRFVVEFDSRCLTERRYDYLEFTDVSGVKKRFDGKFNTERWPQVNPVVSVLCSKFHLHSRLLSFLDPDSNSCSTLMAVIMNGATSSQYVSYTANILASLSSAFHSAEGLWPGCSLSALAFGSAAVPGSPPGPVHLHHSLYEKM